MPSTLLNQFRLDKYTNSINDSAIPASIKYFAFVKSTDEEKNKIIADPNRKEVTKTEIAIRRNLF